MLHLLLPGHSLKNKQELLDIQNFLEENDLETTAHEWLHWQDEEVGFDIETELDLITSEIKGRDNVGIIAKSIGTVVAMRLLEIMERPPEYLLLMGLPIKDADESKKALYQQALKDFPNPIFIVQNEQDPLGSMQEVQEMLEEVEYEEDTTEGDDHRYNYPELVLDIVSKVSS